MNKPVVYSLVVIAGIVLASLTYLKLDIEEPVEPKVNSAIMIDGKIPPQLSYLFPDQDHGPHQKYVDEKSCLVCHKQEITIPGVGLATKIPHEFRPDCVFCHLLPSRAI